MQLLIGPTADELAYRFALVRTSAGTRVAFRANVIAVLAFNPDRQSDSSPKPTSGVWMCVIYAHGQNQTRRRNSTAGPQTGGAVAGS